MRFGGDIIFRQYHFAVLSPSEIALLCWDTKVKRLYKVKKMEQISYLDSTFPHYYFFSCRQPRIIVTNLYKFVAFVIEKPLRQILPG